MLWYDCCSDQLRLRGITSATLRRRADAKLAHQRHDCLGPPPDVVLQLVRLDILEPAGVQPGQGAAEAGNARRRSACRLQQSAGASWWSYSSFLRRHS